MKGRTTASRVWPTKAVSSAGCSKYEYNAAERTSALRQQLHPPLPRNLVGVGRGFRSVDRARGCILRIRSRSRRPTPMDHRFRRDERRLVGSLGSGPWYGRKAPTLARGPLGASGGGVAGLRCAEGSKIEMMSALCSWTVMDGVNADTAMRRRGTKADPIEACLHILGSARQIQSWR